MTQKTSVWNTYGLWGDGDSETVLGGRVKAIENNPNKYSRTHRIDTVWTTPWPAAGSTAAMWSACMYRPSALLHSRTLMVSFSTRRCFETYRDLDTGIKRKSCQANRGCQNTAASPMWPHTVQEILRHALEGVGSFPIQPRTLSCDSQCLIPSRRHLGTVESGWILRSQ